MLLRLVADEHKSLVHSIQFDSEDDVITVKAIGQYLVVIHEMLAVCASRCYASCTSGKSEIAGRECDMPG
jgi:hypothetical protein